MAIDETQHAVAATWAWILARLDGRGLGDTFEAMVEGPDVAG